MKLEITWNCPSPLKTIFLWFRYMMLAPLCHTVFQETKRDAAICCRLPNHTGDHNRWPQREDLENL